MPKCSACMHLEGKAPAETRIQHSPKPVYLKDKTGKEFCIRVGNTTRLSDMRKHTTTLECFRTDNRFNTNSKKCMLITQANLLYELEF